MKRILFVLAIGLSACNSQKKEATVIDTTATNQKIDTKKDTVEKSEEVKADDRLNKIMKNRKNVK
jgi:hypothetical protein